MTGTQLAAKVKVDPADEVFAGHYPGFPILPGLFLVEYVHALVRESRTGLRLAMLDRAKFEHPVYPGDELVINATLTEADHELRCGATISTASGTVAEIRLTYRVGAA